MQAFYGSTIPVQSFMETSEDACVKNGYYLCNFSIGMALDEIANSEDLYSRRHFEANLCVSES